MSNIFKNYKLKAKSTIVKLLIIALQVIWILSLNNWQFDPMMLPIILEAFLLIEQSNSEKIEEDGKKTEDISG